MDKEATLSYKDFPKGDARRYFLALLAADKLKDQATIHYIASEIGCTRAEAQRALDAATRQFGIVFNRTGPVYSIASWGVLKKSELGKFIKAI